MVKPRFAGIILVLLAGQAGFREGTDVSDA
jgi:hypothetical protein